MYIPFLHSITDPFSIIRAAGLIGIFLIIFAESGLFFGFFFPGDSLLFTAGFLASHGLLPVTWLFLGVFAAAVIGDNVGYTFGRRVGPSLFARENSLIFNKKYPERARIFYEKYGKKTVIFARFIPFVRTFAPILAGVGEMDYQTFFLYNIAGGAAWTFLLTGAGLFLGNVAPHADHYIARIILLIVVISILPPVWHYVREQRHKKSAK